ncbi:MAG: metal-dependent hydrolase [SAR86 cluster bacterium]|nr:metal-dependent hydrolase [SAR86 cluster bacterium]
MDPLSQGTVGAAFAQSTANKNNLLKIGVIGFLAGLAPDLDVLIQSSTDPILSLEYHRQFSHSLFFIPFGALIVALLIFPFVKKSMDLKTVYIASFLGYATHGLLDACTSYGTLLFWPFSNERVTWNNISIVDPLFTIPALILVVASIKTKKRIYSFFSIGWIIFYLSLGFVQYERALSTANYLAESRGHNPERLTLKPSFGNLILWKSIYKYEQTFYVDAIRTVQSSTVCLGESIDIFDYQQHLSGLNQESQQAKDVERFRWFSQDYLGFDAEKNLVTDVRYSMLPNQIEPMWGLVIDEQRETNEHAIWWTGRELDQGQWDLFIEMLRGNECKNSSLD